MNTTDYRLKFLKLFADLHSTDMFELMTRTVENSPWHREESVAIHTNMVVHEFITRTPDVWTNQDFLGAVACAFHDTGKPAARTEKYSEARGTYYSYPGHELMSARIFEDWAASGSDFSAEDIYAIGWMIESHMPWEITDKDKRLSMALTAKHIGVEVFTRVLLSDTYGRISDDADKKRAQVKEWVAEFIALSSASQQPTNWADSLTLYVPIGPSGTGKSTHLSKVRAVEPDLAVFSLDLLRHEFYDAHDYTKAYQMSVDDKKFEGRATARFHALVKERKPIYVDNTNLSAKRRKFYLTTARKAGYRLVAILMPVALDTVIQRQTTRSDKTVPVSAVKQHYASLHLPSYGEFDVIEHSSHNLQ